MRSEVQVLLDPPFPCPRRDGRGRQGALAQLVERLLCKQDVNGSNPLGSTISDMIGKRHVAFPSCRTRAWRGHAFTSFREIIGVIGRARVGVRWSSRPTIALSKSSTLTKMCNSCMGIAQKVFSRWKRRETYMLLIGRDPACNKRARAE